MLEVGSQAGRVPGDKGREDAGIEMESWLGGPVGTINSLSLGISGYPQSSAFSKTTKTLAQKKRWENVRCRIYLGLAVAGGLLVILIVLLVTFLPRSGGNSSNP